MVDSGSSCPSCREDPEQVVRKRWQERGLCDADGVVPKEWKNAPATKDSKRRESKHDRDVTRPRSHFKYLTAVKEDQMRNICKARKNRLPPNVHDRAVGEVRKRWCGNGVWDDAWKDKPGRNDNWKYEILLDESARWKERQSSLLIEISCQ
ncbi:hypothetical protein VFPPC_01495 [Pochonia chlamydosporia 170]|uniref:Uncharacterized protein n=1 Tax=Pochonia chlamydosporia 170 TaxID=1380566 RepID=A0A179G7X1_METCM|nr:hypothetical protein VFPPC_01495 [Pochonia chlamydosporia 170]OAQ73897.1 hypothetical protein VFPPC_01495 [Pochonia chlamydosporia 170]